MPILIVPAVEICFLAILCALIYFGTPVIVRLIAATIPSNLPVIGDRLARAVESAGAKAENAMKSAIYSQLRWAAKLIRYPVASVKGHLNYLALTVGSLYHMGQRIITVTIPHQISTVVKHVNVLHAAAIAFTKAQSAILFHRDDVLHLRAINFSKLQTTILRALVAAQIKATTAYIKAQIAATVHRIDSARGEVLAITHAADVAISHQLSQLYNQAVALAHNATAALAGHVEQLYRQSLAHADTAATGAATAAVAALEHDTAIVLGAAWPGLASDVKALEAALGTDLATIGSAVRSIDLTRARTIAEGLAVTTAVSVAALRYMKECGVPNCKNLGGLGHVLHDLQLLIGGEALFTLVAEFAHDPNQAAHTVIDEVGNVVEDLTSNFRHLIGL